MGRHGFKGGWGGELVASSLSPFVHAVAALNTDSLSYGQPEDVSPINLSTETPNSPLAVEE